jgi:hypothetical protein
MSGPELEALKYYTENGTWLGLELWGKEAA